MLIYFLITFHPSNNFRNQDVYSRSSNSLTQSLLHYFNLFALFSIIETFEVVHTLLLHLILGYEISYYKAFFHQFYTQHFESISYAKIHFNSTFLMLRKAGRYILPLVVILLSLLELNTSIAAFIIIIIKKFNFFKVVRQHSLASA